MIFVRMEVFLCALSLCPLAFVHGQALGNVDNDIGNDVAKMITKEKKRRSGRPFFMRIGQRTEPHFESRQPNIAEQIANLSETVDIAEGTRNTENRVLGGDFDETAFWEGYLQGQNSMANPTLNPTHYHQTAPPSHTLATYAPTKQPKTYSPTKQPEGTYAPTNQPETYSPTKQPEGTYAPTKQPEGTYAPTEYYPPLEPVTNAPTKSPTLAPTATPTFANGTPQETVTPTGVPTLPNVVPTTGAPVAKQSPAPTRGPVPPPTFAPSVAPVIPPTAAPTCRPICECLII